MYTNYYSHSETSKPSPIGSWVENLESDLAVNNQNGANGSQRIYGDDRPGPSGITAAQLKELIKIGNQPADDQNKIEKYESVEEEQKEMSPYQVFAEKVTIAGLPEAYNLYLRPARIMFRVALVVAFAMIVYQAIGIIGQHLDEGTIFVDLELINYQAPFPNITVCMKPKINGDQINRYMNDLPGHIYKRIHSFNVTLEDSIKFFKKAMAMEGEASDIHSRAYMAFKTFFDASVELSSKNGKSFLWELMYQNCSTYLSNCAFNGQKFDCCEASRFYFYYKFSCFQIKQANVTLADIDATKNKDPLRLEDTGLTFDMSTNWTNNYDLDDSASDGYHVFIEIRPDYNRLPVHVPADMDVTITLAQPTKLDEKTGCRYNPLTLTYSDYYDPYGIFCQAELSHDLVLKSLGCNFPTWGYYPINNSCTFGPLFLITLSINSGVDELVGNTANSGLGTRDKETDGLALIRGHYSPDSPCKPLCSRWAYPIFSSSYGSIQYKDDNVRKEQTANRSWSRIKVIVPRSSSSHKEQAKASPYLALCDVGGMMGVWAGFSMITFAQMGAYGFLICWSKWKKRNQVQPKKENLPMKKITKRTDQVEIEMPKIRPKVIITNEVIETEL